MNADSTPAIHTVGLGKRYGSMWALQDCSISVPPGRVTALVGPNGAGQSAVPSTPGKARDVLPPPDRPVFL